MTTVTIYTDGGYRPKEGIGAWACLLQYKEHYKELSGHCLNTTNNIMELTAVINALNALKRPCNVKLYSDSEYVVKGITTWIHTWIKNGWKSADKTPVKNQQYWKELYELTKRHDITFTWVKGHDKNEKNNRVDFLCNQAMNNALRM